MSATGRHSTPGIGGAVVAVLHWLAPPLPILAASIGPTGPLGALSANTLRLKLRRKAGASGLGRVSSVRLS